MPRFHFDIRGEGEHVADEIGAEFESLELAYLDAYRGMVRMGADMLLEQKNPSELRIDILGEDGTMLMTLPFNEVFARRASPVSPSEAYGKVRRQFEASRRLGEEIREACARARVSVATARDLVDRSQRLKLRMADLGR